MVDLVTAFLLLPRVRPLSHPEIHEGSWSLPGPRGDGNGGSAPVAHQVLSLPRTVAGCL